MLIKISKILKEINDDGFFSKINIFSSNVYTSDKNAFIFKFDSQNNKIEKYPIKDSKNAIKIGNTKDDDLFVIGKNDIVIKKREKKVFICVSVGNERVCNGEIKAGNNEYLRGLAACKF